MLSGVKVLADVGVVSSIKGQEFLILSLVLSLVLFTSGWRADGGKIAGNVCVWRHKSIHC